MVTCLNLAFIIQYNTIPGRDPSQNSCERKAVRTVDQRLRFGPFEAELLLSKGVQKVHRLRQLCQRREEEKGNRSRTEKGAGRDSWLQDQKGWSEEKEKVEEKVKHHMRV